MTDMKDDFLKMAMKAMQNPTVQKLMANEKVQKGFANAFKASYEVKSKLDEKKSDFAEQLNLATKDDLRTMKRELDRLQRQVSKLKKQQTDDSASAKSSSKSSSKKSTSKKSSAKKSSSKKSTKKSPKKSIARAVHVTPPKILLTNDDGIDARGLAALEAALQDLGEVWVVAPDTEQSAVSQAITLRLPVRVRNRGAQRYSISGTPTDCVYVALNRLLEDVDICVSGINHGANLGDDVLYSGTVAGAIEATLLDVPSIAVSLATYGDFEFEAAADAARRLADKVLVEGLPRGVFLNVNVPRDARVGDELVVCKLGRRNYGRVVEEKHDPRDRPYYWLGGAEMGFDDLPGSDCNVISNGQISVTPVHLDMTHYRFARELENWEGLRGFHGLETPRQDSSRGDASSD
jgi:5'-nucleotidase